MTMITTPAQFTHFHIAQVRGVCRLLHVGMTQRGMTKHKAALLAEGITGKKYKVSELETAANDITAHLKEHFHDTDI